MIEFKKSYSRDTTFFMQVLWAQGLTELAGTKFGWRNPHLPFVAHFVNNGVVEIWEHEPAIAWFLDTLLAENKKGPTLLQNLFEEYKKLLAELSILHDKDSFSNSEDVKAYTDLVYQAAFAMTIFFYTGTDERSPKEAQDISMEARKAGDFFAENDVFVRKHIARMGNLSQEQAGVVLPHELVSLPNTETLNKRLAACLLIDGKEMWTGSLTEFMAAHSEYNFKSNSAPSAELPRETKGQVGFRGKVEGVVRIVRKQRDMDKVQEGDILVSPMTTPDFLPAMQRAAAFVTNEGGVTCHAAIVAREMKKPCVIGTKIATHVFKDGDLVEVDAEKGVVTILNRT